MSLLSPRLQAHFISLMMTTEDSVLSGGSVSSTGAAADLITVHDRRAMAETTARLAQEEIDAMQRAVYELEHIVELAEQGGANISVDSESMMGDSDENESVRDDDERALSATIVTMSPRSDDAEDNDCIEVKRRRID
jgi:hypothetical protein